MKKVIAFTALFVASLAFASEATAPAKSAPEANTSVEAPTVPAPEANTSVEAPTVPAPETNTTEKAPAAE